jgi:hypothetical protein
MIALSIPILKCNIQHNDIDLTLLDAYVECRYAKFPSCWFTIKSIMLKVIMLCVVMLSVITLSVIKLSVISVILLGVIMLSVIMLSVIMLSVIMLKVVMPNVMAPIFLYLLPRSNPLKLFLRNFRSI